MFFEDDKDDSLVGDFAAAAKNGYEAAKAEDKAKKEKEAKEKEDKRDEKINDSLK
jgi:ribosomal protein L12E/L44/L45/RPP1/RPP2